MRYICHVPSDRLFRTVVKAAEHFELPVSAIVKDRVNFKWMAATDPFPIRLKQTNRVFENVLDASRQLRIPQKRIVHALNSKKPVNGYTFEYADEPEQPPEPCRLVRKGGYMYSVICHETGQEFESITEAARVLDIAPSGISKVLNGQRPHIYRLTFGYGAKVRKIRTRRKKPHNDLFGPIHG